MFKIFTRKTLKPKCQTAEEYWHERNNRNKQKSQTLGVNCEELKETSFLDQSNKYKPTAKNI